MRKHLPIDTQLVVRGRRYTGAEATARVEQRVEALDAVVAAHAALTAAIEREAQLRKASADLMTGMKQALLSMFGSSPEILADLGMRERKPRRPATTEELALSTARARATRAVRHTMGKNQKSKLRGEVTMPPSPTPAQIQSPLRSSTASFTLPSSIAHADRRERGGREDAALSSSAGAVPEGRLRAPPQSGQRGSPIGREPPE